MSWAEIWQAEPQRINFLIQVVYDVLPSPANLHLWGMGDSPACFLCPGKGSLEHILSSCPKALGEGRYRWRHDQVLKAVAETVCKAVANHNSKKQQLGKRNIAFIRAGEQPQSQSKPAAGLLTSASDWELSVDLGKQLKFPDHIAMFLRPDVVLSSVASRQVLLIELTVPWEDRIEEANERKRSNYQELVEQCQGRGWKARCEPIEVGCRGFAGCSLCKVYTLLGIRGLQKGKPSRTPWRRQKEPPDGFGSGGAVGQWDNAAGSQARS